MRSILIASLLLLISGCDLQKMADDKFGDQHFKTTVALIELHKLRSGTYPETLKDLKFTGEWDQIALNSVSYKKLDNGYELNVERGWVGAPELSLPADFFRNTGVVRSNVAGK